MNKYKCIWLDSYLKELLLDKDLKNYNRAKLIIYYFPTILNVITKVEFDLAIKNADETHVCLGQNDRRYKVFDILYKTKHGYDFEPPKYSESRYLSLDDIYKYFKI